MIDTRKQAELDHGRFLVGRAARVWGQAGRAGQERVRRRSRLLLEAAGARPEMRILELGCGTGEYTARLCGRAAGEAELVALDLSHDLLRLASARPLPAPVRFVRGDAERLPFPTGSFDAVVGNAVLHHLRVGAALAEVRRVLRPEGRCAFSEPNMLNPQVVVQKNVPPIKRWLGDTPHETAFLAPQVRQALLAAGLTVERVEPFDFLHPAIPAWAVAPAQRLEAWLERLPLVSGMAGSLLIVARR
jgi:SAM-dependent methyltransferase